MIVRVDESTVKAYHNVCPHRGTANGHGRFYGGKKTPMAGHLQEPQGDPLAEMAARLTLLIEGLDAMVLKEDVDTLLSLRCKTMAPGSTLGAEYVKALYARAAARDCRAREGFQ